jgi:hypothetical protein
MTDRFDELAKDLANGLSRREALRRVGLAMAGSLLAALGLAGGARAQILKGGGGRNRCHDTCEIAFNSGYITNVHACEDACHSCNSTGGEFCVASTGVLSCCLSPQTCSSTGTCA